MLTGRIRQEFPSRIIPSYKSSSPLQSENGWNSNQIRFLQPQFFYDELLLSKILYCVEMARKIHPDYSMTTLEVCLSIFCIHPSPAVSVPAIRTGRSPIYTRSSPWPDRAAELVAVHSQNNPVMSYKLFCLIEPPAVSPRFFDYIV